MWNTAILIIIVKYECPVYLFQDSNDLDNVNCFLIYSNFSLKLIPWLFPLRAGKHIEFCRFIINNGLKMGRKGAEIDICLTYAPDLCLI